MNRRLLIINVGLLLGIIGGVFYQFKLKKQAEEFDKVFQIKDQDEQRILHNYLAQLEEYARKKREIGQQVDIIRKVINRNELEKKERYDYKYISSIIHQLEIIDTSFKISFNENESNLSILNRSLKKFSNFQNSRYEPLDLKIYLKSIYDFSEDSLLIKCEPFNNVVTPNLLIYAGDKKISSSSPFTFNGEASILRAEITNPVTGKTEKFSYVR